MEKFNNTTKNGRGHTIPTRVSPDLASPMVVPMVRPDPAKVAEGLSITEKRRENAAKARAKRAENLAARKAVAEPAEPSRGHPIMHDGPVMRQVTKQFVEGEIPESIVNEVLARLGLDSATIEAARKLSSVGKVTVTERKPEPAKTPAPVKAPAPVNVSAISTHLAMQREAAERSALLNQHIATLGFDVRVESKRYGGKVESYTGTVVALDLGYTRNGKLICWSWVYGIDGIKRHPSYILRDYKGRAKDSVMVKGIAAYQHATQWIPCEGTITDQFSKTVKVSVDTGAEVVINPDPEGFDADKTQFSGRVAVGERVTFYQPRWKVERD